MDKLKDSANIFPEAGFPAEIRWGRPPGLRGTPSSRSFCGLRRLAAGRCRTGGRAADVGVRPTMGKLCGTELKHFHGRRITWQLS